MRRGSDVSTNQRNLKTKLRKNPDKSTQQFDRGESLKSQVMDLLTLEDQGNIFLRDPVTP